MASCPNYVAAGKLLSRPEPASLYPTRPGTSPSLISFRARPGSAIRCSLNDTVTVLQEKQAAQTFYELLGIPDTGSLLEIKQAYKQLVRKYHPDVSPPGRVEEYTQTFIMVQEAYETLSDPSRRELYDMNIRMGLQFGFGSPSRFDYQQMGDKSQWKSRWESQLSGLRARSMYKQSNDNMSWAARMRREREEQEEAEADADADATS